MSKILNHYENNVDKTWYNSSNIIYSECDDKDNELKVVRITFKNGRTYEYIDVKVNDYLMFREAQSQGKAFNTFMKSYDTQRIEGKNVDELLTELDELQHPTDDSFNVVLENSSVIIKKGKEVVYNNEALSEETTDILAQIFSVLNIKTEIKIEKEND